MAGEEMAKQVEEGAEYWKKKFFETLEKTEPLVAVLIEGAVGPLIQKILRHFDNEHALIDLSNMSLSEALSRVGEIKISKGGLREDALVFDKAAFDRLVERAKKFGVKVVKTDTFIKDGKESYFVAFVGKNVAEFIDSINKSPDMNHIKYMKEGDFKELLNYMAERKPFIERVIEEHLPVYNLKVSEFDAKGANETVNNIVSEIEAHLPLTEADKRDLKQLFKERLPMLSGHQGNKIRELSENIIANAYFSHAESIKDAREEILNLCNDTIKNVSPEQAKVVENFKNWIEQIPQHSSFFFNFDKIMSQHFKSVEDKMPMNKKWDIYAKYFEGAYSMFKGANYGVKINSSNFLSGLSNMLQKLIDELIKQFAEPEKGL